MIKYLDLTNMIVGFDCTLPDPHDPSLSAEDYLKFLLIDEQTMTFMIHTDLDADELVIRTKLIDWLFELGEAFK